MADAEIDLDVMGGLELGEQLAQTLASASAEWRLMRRAHIVALAETRY